MVLGHQDRELFKGHPDRAWVLKAGSPWLPEWEGDVDTFEWWSAEVPTPAATTHPAKFSIDALRNMQLHEVALRLSTATQSLLSKVYRQQNGGESLGAPFHSIDDTMEALQVFVVRAAGVAEEHTTAGLHTLRNAQAVLQQARDSPDMPVTGPDSFAPHYVRFNRLIEGSVPIGSVMPNCSLADMDLKPTHLLDAMVAASGPHRRPVLVVASSLT